MKLHEVDLCGQHLYLCLNGQALFDLYDKFGTKGFITDPLKGSGKKSFEAVCYYLMSCSHPQIPQRSAQISLCRHCQPAAWLKHPTVSEKRRPISSR